MAARAGRRRAAAPGTGSPGRRGRTPHGRDRRRRVVESLLAALQDREQRRAHIRAAITEQERQQAAQRDQGDSLAVMREALLDWQGMLHAETGPARTALQALLAGRLVFTPGPEGYTFSGVGTVAPIIAGVVPKGSGARTRTIPPAIRRALHHRDRGCRFPGRGVRFGQGHHIRHWAQGGPTTLSNLAMLCRRHHRAVHEEGYQLDRQPDGALSIPPPRRQALARGSAASRGTRRSCASPRGAARRRGASSPCADGNAGLDGRAPGRGLGDQRLAPIGGVKVMARKVKPPAWRRASAPHRGPAPSP
jgi:HNH endonuclease